MSSVPEVMFVVLSDLHFGNDLTEETSGCLYAVHENLRFFDVGIRKFFVKRCGSHDMNIVKSLPRYLKTLASEYVEKGFSSSAFDLFLVLGDQATLPTESAYHFLSKYLTSLNYTTGDQDLQHKCAGLGLSAEQLICIPGNHDKMLMSDLSFYQREFGSRVTGSAEPEKQSASFKLVQIRNRKFVFLLVEASKYASESEVLDSKCRSHLASGEISAELTKEIKSKFECWRNGEEVDGISASDFQEATRVMLVHYAVDGIRVCGAKQMVQDLFVPHECKGLSTLVEELSRDIHLVIHGHLHHPKLYRHGNVPVVAATTTTQRGSNNGFFLIKFFESGEIAAEHHRWLQTGFLLDTNAELNQTLSRAHAAR